MLRSQAFAWLFLSLSTLSACSDKDDNPEPSALSQAASCESAGLQHGESKQMDFFTQSKVSFGESCEAKKVSVAVQCENGELIRESDLDLYTRCELDPPANCAEAGLKDGEQRAETAYLFAEVPYGESCEDSKIVQTTSCSNGIVTVDQSDYQFRECRMAEPKSCDEIGLSHGESRKDKLYTSESVPFGDSCQAGERISRCDNGKVTIENEHFQFADCAPEEPLHCENADLKHGESRVDDVFSQSSAIDSSICDEARSMMTISCFNGKTTIDGANPSDFPFPSCTLREPLDCVDDDMTHGETINYPLFSQEQLPYGQSCDSVRKDREKTCFDGKVSFSGTSAAEYPYTSCQVQDPANCEVEGLAHGESVAIDQQFSRVFATEGMCSDFLGEQIRTCDNGQMKTTQGQEFQYQSCKDPFGDDFDLQYWVYQDGEFQAPWDSSNPSAVTAPETLRPVTESCRVASQKALNEALSDDEVNQLFAQIYALGGTQKLTLVTSDTGELRPESKYAQRDRAAYFWHWNQDRKLPSLAMSRFDRGTWVWESNVYRERCTHPDLKEMKRYLKYAIQRLKAK